MVTHVSDYETYVTDATDVEDATGGLYPMEGMVKTVVTILVYHMYMHPFHLLHQCQVPPSITYIGCNTRYMLSPSESTTSVSSTAPTSSF